jgi:hypothetical protein
MIISIIQNSEEKIAATLRLSLVSFQKVGLVYSRIGARAGAAGAAGAESKFLLGAVAA